VEPFEWLCCVYDDGFPGAPAMQETQRLFFSTPKPGGVGTYLHCVVFIMFIPEIDEIFHGHLRTFGFRIKFNEF